MGTASVDQNQSRILVVEDDLDIRASLVDILQDAGYCVREAGDGAEAIAKLHDGSPAPHLILLDLMMPVMNGFEFREAQLRSDFAGVPVVVITADTRAKQKAEQLQVNGFAQKPLKIASLLQLVKHHLQPAQRV